MRQISPVAAVLSMLFDSFINLTFDCTVVDWIKSTPDVKKLNCIIN